MKQMKHYALPCVFRKLVQNISYLVIATTIVSTFPTCPMGNMLNNDMFEDLIDLDNDLDSQLLSIEKPEGIALRATPEEIIAALVLIDAQKILEEDFYLRTNPFNNRSLLDLPINELNQCCVCPESWLVGFYLFYNHTNRSNFTAHSTDLKSYLALTQDTLLEKLQNSVDQLINLFNNPAFNLNVRDILSLFSRMTVEQRRAGFMFHMWRQYKCSEVRLWLPIYYLERNFFLRDHEIRRIEQELGRSSPEQQEEFQDRFLISDKLGIGDLRLEWDRKIGESCVAVRLGFLVTVPTAFAFAKGLKGHSFCKSDTTPIFDFQELFNLSDQIITSEIQQRAFNMIRGYFLGALDRLSANLLDAPLGNGGHIGLGFLMRTKTNLSSVFNRDWAECIVLDSRLFWEFLLPATETRFFIRRNFPADFEARNFEDPAQAVSNLDFFEQEFANKLYAIAIPTTVKPGPIFRWSSKACYNGGCWQAALGSDMWIQLKESFNSIDAVPPVRRRLDVCVAKAPFAYQSKLFGSINYVLDRPSQCWSFGLLADYTYWSSGIGKDYTLAINIEAKF